MSMLNVGTTEELRGILWRITQPSKTKFKLWSMQIRPNSENLLMVIRSIKIKDQLWVIFSSFVYECFNSWICFLRNVNLVIMLACAWNKWTCVSNILSFWISLMFIKKNKFHNHKVKKNENVVQMFDFESWKNWWLLLVINPSR